jgi:hypothetical protein
VGGDPECELQLRRFASPTTLIVNHSFDAPCCPASPNEPIGSALDEVDEQRAGVVDVGFAVPFLARVVFSIEIAEACRWRAGQRQMYSTAYVQAPELRAVLTAQWGDYGLPPKVSSFGIHAIVTSHYFDGAAYPIGGAGQIAASLLPTIEAAGGAVVVGAEVERILVEGGRAIGVRMSDGRELRARYVVSDAGVHATFQQLLPEGVTPAIRATVARLGGLEPSTAHVCLYAGIDEAKFTAPLDGTNLWVHPGLDFDRNYADANCGFHGAASARRLIVFNILRLITKPTGSSR